MPHLHPPPPITYHHHHMATSTSSPSPPTISAAATTTTAPPPPTYSSSRRLPPPCWSHDETLALIDSYREKWYSLHRSNLRAAHWQEVADAVSHRCHLLPTASPKTSLQCRHKIEKLRKRYRSEKQRSLSSWVYFPKMDALERGEAASRSSPAAAARSDDDEEEEEDEDDDDGRGGGNTRSFHRMAANGGGGIGGLRFRIPKAVRSKIVGSRAEERAAPSPSSRLFSGYGGLRPGMEEVRRRFEKRKRKEREVDPVGEMVSALRMLEDGFMRIEQMKMEMAREVEKVRMEMELKHTEMILDLPRQIVDAFVKGFTWKKRAKVSPES